VEYPITRKLFFPMPSPSSQTQLYVVALVESLVFKTDFGIFLKYYSDPNIIAEVKLANNFKNGNCVRLFLSSRLQDVYILLGRPGEFTNNLSNIKSFIKI
jgi:hypothetical protein